MIKQFTNEHGQIVLILILVMTVALAIGISVIQRSLSDISTSTKVEESSRAFSAAEAGIEKSLAAGGVSLNDIPLGNNSQIKTVTPEFIPALPAANSRQDAYELGKLKKEDVATIWLADYNSATNPPPVFYAPTTGTLDIYWGDPDPSITPSDRAALELTLVYYGVDPNDGQKKYLSRKWYLEDDSAQRFSDNNFTRVTCGSTNPPAGYRCKYKIGGANYNGPDSAPLPFYSAPDTNILTLLRARLLYNPSAQPFAVQATGTCGTCSLPAQTRVITSTGVAGVTQRTVRVSQELKAIPPYFDYAIFSAGDITK